jgi:hypothetical protein
LHIVRSTRTIVGRAACRDITERLDATPCLVTGHLVVAPRLVKRGFQHTAKHLVGGGSARPLHFGITHVDVTIARLLAGLAAQSRRGLGECVQPIADLLAGETVHAHVAKLGPDVSCGLGARVGNILLAAALTLQPREIIIERLIDQVGAGGGFGQPVGGARRLRVTGTRPGLGLREIQYRGPIGISQVVGGTEQGHLILAAAQVYADVPGTARGVASIGKVQAGIDGAEVGFDACLQAGAGGAGVQLRVQNGTGHS